jgi:alkylmercury lyase
LWLGLLDQDWELMTDSRAHLALGWPAGDTGRHAAQRLRESVTPEVARAALEAMSKFDVTALLPRLKASTPVLHRGDIPWLPVGIARSVASRIPDARLSILEGESTAPYLGDSEAAASAIEEFLGEGGRGTEQREADAPASEQDRLGPTRGSSNGLTTREVEVLRRLDGGQTNSEIAEELFVSVRTVEHHIANIYRKIGARGRANATAYALTRGLIDLLARGNPASSEEIAATSGKSPEEVRAALDRFPSTESDEQGRVVGLGLTLQLTPHRLELEGRALFAWCALDALLIPVLLGRPASLESPCRDTGEPVHIEVTPAGIEMVEPLSAVVSIVAARDLATIRSVGCKTCTSSIPRRQRPAGSRGTRRRPSYPWRRRSGWGG